MSARIYCCCWCRVWGHSVDGQHPNHWTADQYCLSSMTTVNYCYCQTPDWFGRRQSRNAQPIRVRAWVNEWAFACCVCVWRVASDFSVISLLAAAVFLCVGKWVLMRLVALMSRVFVWQCLAVVWLLHESVVRITLFVLLMRYLCVRFRGWIWWKFVLKPWKKMKKRKKNQCEQHKQANFPYFTNDSNKKLCKNELIRLASAQLSLQKS